MLYVNAWYIVHVYCTINFPTFTYNNTNKMICNKLNKELRSF